MKTKQFIVALISITLFMPMTLQAQRLKTKKNAPIATQEADSLKMIKVLAEGGNSTAQNTLGFWYYVGLHVDKNQKEAVSWWTKAAEKDNADALGNLAMCYQLGHGCRADSTLASKLYKKAIQKGNQHVIPQHDQLARNQGSVFSALLLYDVYSSGIGIKRDMRKANEYLSLAAGRGNTDSIYALAMQYLNAGEADKAAPLFLKASKAGLAGATYYYGYLLFKGMGIGQDKAEGIRYMQDAADKGFTAANYELGRIYFEGDGTETDGAKAVAYLTKDATYHKSQWLLGLCYLNGTGVECNFYKAAQWMAEAHKSHKEELNELLRTDNEGPFSQYLMGLKHYYVNKDYAAAMASFKKARNVEADAMTAMCLANKNYEKRNVKKAFKTMKKAAKGSAAAKYWLSTMYENSVGTDKDTKIALELLSQAAEEGIAYAQCRLGERYMTGTGVAQDYVQAAQLFLKAEAQNRLTDDAARLLAKCYERKISVLPDLKNAKERIEKLRKHKENTTLTDMLRLLSE